ncbi:MULTISPECIES: hypothetical protein [unclassified Ruminococcus]|uniref:hypothetical protein n=1 Tax=unclassified Ruminococcus TaxID=2608920 RepID=UPI00319E5FB5
MADLDIGKRINELCDNLENALSELLSDEPDALDINVDLYHEQIQPAMADLREVFSNVDDSIVSSASIFLQENSDNIKDLPEDRLASLCNAFTTCSEDSSFFSVLRDTVDDAISNCSATGDFDKITEYVKNLVDDLRSCDFNDILTDDCKSIISDATDILSGHLDSLPEDEKQKIIDSDAGKELFTYSTNEDGSIDKDTIKAVSGMTFDQDGSLTDKFGFTFDGDLIKKFDFANSVEPSDEIKDFCLLLNDLYKGEDGFVFLDQYDRDNLADVLKIKSFGLEIPEHCKESMAKYGAALQRLYNVDIQDKEKVSDTIEKFLDKDEDVAQKATNDNTEKASSESGFEKASYEWGNADQNPGDDFKNDKSDNENQYHDTNNDFQTSKDRYSVKAAEAEQHGRSIIWEKTGNDKIDQFIEKRNEFIKNDSLFPTYRKRFGYNYSTMKAIFLARKEKEPINGKVPTIYDCMTAFSALYNTNLYSAIFLGILSAISKEEGKNDIDKEKDKISTENVDSKKEEAQKAKADQEGKLAEGKLEKSVVDMAKNISSILNKPEKDRTSRDKKDLLRTSGSYFYSARDLIQLYGSEKGVETIKGIVSKAFDSAFSEKGVSGSGMARLSLLISQNSIFKVDGDKIKIDFGDLLKNHDQKDSATNDDDKDKDVASTDNTDVNSDKADADDEEDPDKTEVDDEEDPDKADADDEEDPDKTEADEEEDPDKTEADDEEELDKTDTEDEEDPDKAEADDEEAPDKTEADDEEDPDEADADNKEDPDKTEADDEEDPDKTEADDEEDPDEADANDEEDPDKADADDEEDPDKTEADDEEELDKADADNEDDPDKADTDDEEDPDKVEADDENDPDKITADDKEPDSDKTDSDSDKTDSDEENEDPDKTDSDKENDDQESNADNEKEHDKSTTDTENERRNGGDIDSSLEPQPDTVDHTPSDIQDTDDPDEDDLENAPTKEVNVDNPENDQEMEPDFSDDPSTADDTSFNEQEPDIQEADAISGAMEDMDIGDSPEYDDIEMQDVDFAEIDPSDYKDNEVDGIAEAVAAYAEEPDVGFSDFLDMPITVNGDEMSIEEAYNNEAISNEDIADAIVDSISSNAEDIMGNDDIMEAYSDMLNDVSDMCGNSFMETVCDKMDPFSSVDDAVDGAFNSISDDMAVPDYVLDAEPDFDVFDLADMEFSILDNIDNDNIIADGVEAGMQDFGQEQISDDSLDGVDATAILQNQSDLSNDDVNSHVTQDDGFNQMPDYDPDTSAFDMGQNSAVNTSDDYSSYEPESFDYGMDSQNSYSNDFNNNYSNDYNNDWNSIDSVD